MLPLYTATFPTSASDLAKLLNASVQCVFRNTANPVTIRDRNFPSVAEIRITLDGAALRGDPPRPPIVEGADSAALHVDELHLHAGEMRIGPALASIRLDARAVDFDQAKDAKGEVVLMLKTAAEGKIEVSAEQQAIESAIAAVARQEAGQHGVVIDQVQLAVRPRGERGIDAEVQLRAKKLVFATAIKITAKLDLDEELGATVSGLACKGDGAIGAMACGFLQPHLQKMEGRSFSLMALPLGEIRLRDVRIAVGKTLSVTAEFGA